MGKAKTLAVLACVLLVLTLAACKTNTAPNKPATSAGLDKKKLLTVADVTKVTGIQGVKIVDKDPSKGAGGDLNFATPDGKMLLLLVVTEDANAFAEWKRISVAPISGVGDEAVSGPKGVPEPYNVYVRSNNRFFSLASFLDSQGQMKPLLTIAQLTELAKIVVSRL
ncbi:MAG: hypothetical protein Q8L35_05720 [Actinomycetota bacterium]|nr:hypothetical protein [Actinomycetota bacterium]